MFRVLTVTSNSTYEWIWIDDIFDLFRNIFGVDDLNAQQVQLHHLRD